LTVSQPFSSTLRAFRRGGSDRQDGCLEAAIGVLSEAEAAGPVRPVALSQEETHTMKKVLTLLAAGAMTLSLTACYTPGDRALGGAAIGSATGAVIGAAATGRPGGALAGAAIGAVSGAAIGAATSPAYARPVYRRPVCPYGAARDAYGNLYCL
jgi:osmotically inducible lipoprotein OsmB